MVAKLEHHTALSSVVGTTAAALQNAGAGPLECPRCESTNTKFCYYNNYSLAQPRHFCKACKRYWTRGGTLRNVPVGGGCRKNKRTKKTRSPAAYDSPRKAPLSANSQPPAIRSAATGLAPLPYGLLPANSAHSLFLPKSDLHAQLAGYEENFQTGLGAQLARLQHSTSAETAALLGGYSLLNSDQLPSSSPAEAESCYHPLLSYDHDHLPLGSGSLGLIMGSNKSNTFNFAEDHSFGALGATVEPSYLYWNHAAGSGWPEPGSSAAPLR